MHLNGWAIIDEITGGKMEESRKEEKAADREKKRPTVTIAPAAPEREMPKVPTEETEIEAEEIEQEHARGESHEQSEPGDDADAELNIMLKQIEAYFSKQARHHDLEAISFSLRHLFSRIDFLYRQALPELSAWTTREDKSKKVFLHQQIWLHLQAVNRTLDRMAPLCHLLSDVVECLLDTLDNEELWLRTFEEEETLLLQQVHPSMKKQSYAGKARHTGEQEKPATSELEDWERAVTMLMDRLLLWQEQHHKLASFQQQFAQPPLATNNLEVLDSAFAVLLDSAGAIFGDILPNFRLVGREEQEEISALLFDLMQQSDQMLVQFELTLEPLTSLLRHFGALSEGS
jgi:hypothetical protein